MSIRATIVLIVLSSEHFDVYYYPEEEATVTLQPGWPSEKLILYAAPPYFQPDTGILEPFRTLQNPSEPFRTFQNCW